MILTYWRAAALMRHPRTGALSIRNVPREILEQNPRVFEAVIAHHADAMVYRQRRRWDPRRQEHIDRLQAEYRELRAMELEGH